MTWILSTGMVSPLGLGREESISSWRDLHSGTGETTSALLPNKRWPTEGFPRRDAGLVVGFNARKQLPDRKATKLMSRESQLAVYAAVEAGGMVPVVPFLPIAIGDKPQIATLTEDSVLFAMPNRG